MQVQSTVASSPDSDNVSEETAASIFSEDGSDIFSRNLVLPTYTGSV